jgi:hypothetical protein
MVIAPRAREASVQISPLSPYGLTVKAWIRGRLLWWLINLGVADKGPDCEAVAGWHRWYKSTEEIDGCYHCEVTRRRSIT